MFDLPLFAGLMTELITALNSMEILKEYDIHFWLSAGETGVKLK